MCEELTYTQNGNYLIPNIELKPKHQVRPVGKYGGLRLTFLQETRPGQYQHLIMSGELNKHLADINEAAMQRVDLISKQILEVNPAPNKKTDMMGWIQHQKNAMNAVDEIILNELIYT